MDSAPCWMLTDALAQTPAGGVARFKWGRGVTHTAWGPGFYGYSTDSTHLPFLLDPLYERYGSRARLWLSEVGEPHSEESVRISSNAWTTLDEWQRPAWVGAEAEMRVRLRFALLAAAAVLPRAEQAARLRAVSLDNIPVAARQAQQICSESREGGGVPQCLCLAAMAVRSAAALLTGDMYLIDLVARHCPVYTWYAGMAAVCSYADLSAVADEAARWECLEVRAPARAAEVAVV